VDVDPKARLAQEEVFGPVLAVIKAKKLRPGAGNCEQYGIWLDRRGVLEEPEKSNRPKKRSTSVILSKSEVHRRDGRRASVWRVQHVGTDSKAGGKDYLLLFMQGKSIAEKVS